MLPYLLILAVLAGGTLVWFFKEHAKAKVKQAEDAIHAAQASLNKPEAPKSK